MVRPEICNMTTLKQAKVEQYCRTDYIAVKLRKYRKKEVLVKAKIQAGCLLVAPWKAFKKG